MFSSEPKLENIDAREAPGQEKYLSFMEKEKRRERLFEQEAFLEELRSGEAKLEGQTASLFESLRKKFKKGFAPVAMFLLVSGFASKALAKEFENENPDVVVSTATLGEVEKAPYKAFAAPFRDPVELPNKVEGDFSDYRDDFINELKKVKSIGYEIEIDKNINVVSTGGWQNDRTISFLNDLISEKLADGNLPVPVRSLKDLPRSTNSSGHCALTAPGFMGCDKKIKAPALFLEIEEQYEDGKNVLKMVVNNWQEKVWETGFSEDENRVIKEIDSAYRQIDILDSQMQELREKYGDEESRLSGHGTGVFKDSGATKRYRDLEEGVNKIYKNIFKLKARAADFQSIERAVEFQKNADLSQKKDLLESLGKYKELTPVYQKADLKIPENSENLKILDSCMLRVVGENALYGIDEGEGLLELEKQYLENGLKINGVVNYLSCSFPNSSGQDLVQEKYFLDKYGNGVLLNSDQENLYFVISHPTPKEKGKGAESQYREFRFDLSSAGISGLGEVGGVIYEKVERPLQVIGANGEYAIFSNLPDDYIQNQFGERFGEIVAGIANFEKEFGYQGGELVKNVFIYNSTKGYAFFEDSNPDSIAFQLGKFDQANSVVAVAFHESGHLLDHSLGEDGKYLSQSESFQDFFYSLANETDFFSAINESSFLPGSGASGHSQDNEQEFFTTLLNSLNHPDWESAVGNRDPHFRKIYLASLLELRALLKTKVKKDAPFLKAIDDRIEKLNQKVEQDEKEI